MTDIRPYFSVIVVCLNVENVIGMTIDSVIQQTSTDYEIIVKDGCSTDQTVSKIPEHNRISVYVKKDTGIYDAMNQALQVAKGKYVFFLNCGDTFADPMVLEDIKNQSKGSKAGILYGDIYQREHEETVLSPQKVTPFFLYRTLLCHQACFFRLSLFKITGGFDLSYKILGDYNFLAKMVLEEHISLEYFHRTISTYMGGGFSVRKDLVKLKRKELGRIRTNYFGRFQRLFYKFILALTLPRLRAWLMESDSKWIKRLYLCVVNTIYRETGGHQ